MAGFRGHIISAEPNPEAFRVLESKASGDERWQVRNVAVGEKDGEQPFAVTVGEQFSTLSESIRTDTNIMAHLNAVSERVEVQVEALGTFASWARRRVNYARPCLKMDTQGYDALIVRAGRECLGECVGIQSELSFKRLYADLMKFEEMLHFLRGSRRFSVRSSRTMKAISRS